MPSVKGRLYHTVSCSVARGVRDETSPVSSASDFFCRVIKEIRMVTVKHVVQAAIAVQKFCAISLG